MSPLLLFWGIFYSLENQDFSMVISVEWNTKWSFKLRINYIKTASTEHWSDAWLQSSKSSLSKLITLQNECFSDIFSALCCLMMMREFVRVWIQNSVSECVYWTTPAFSAEMNQNVSDWLSHSLAKQKRVWLVIMLNPAIHA